jgi:hypothetical protein
MCDKPGGVEMTHERKLSFYLCMIIICMGVILFMSSIVARWIYIPSTNLVTECTKEIVTIENGPMCTQMRQLYTTVTNLGALGFSLAVIFSFAAWRIDYGRFKKNGN